ncbi:M42 family metallopeptidase [Caproiciproducens sp. R2]|uniref:M42 family metallopeptidase n=1 Tax=Caproiciproducens sp. R2 TaxID=3435187 RepID=UPI004033C6EA
MDWKLLERLCTARGISGQEDEVRKIILEEIKPYATSIEITPLGSLIVFKKGAKRPKTKLMLNAHMDEVGMIVTYITDDGLLKFETVGGIDRRVLCGRPVTVGAEVGGVIGAKPIHLLEEEEKEKSVPVKELYIDIGAKDREEAERYVAPGDPVTFDSVFDTSHGMIKSRALDDRAGCAMMIHMIQSELKYDLYFVFAIQEETGLTGSRTAAFAVEPQAAIVLESTTAADVAGVDKENRVCCVGGGAVISFMDKRTIYDKEYYQLAFQAAKKAGVSCQPKRAVAGGNDAGAIHVSRGGVRTIAVSLPCRYLHSAVSLISQEDFISAQKLVCELADRIAGEEQDD